MECLNLAARSLYDILNELDIRSINKHFSSLTMIRDMQKDPKSAKNEEANNMRFFNILKTLGFEFTVGDDNTDEVKNPELLKLLSNLDDQQIDIFDQEEVSDEGND
jgi:hypothetical protein